MDFILKKKLGIFAFFCCLTASMQAATVDTVSTYSSCMKKNIKAILIKPDDYSKSKKYPVLYLLHGYGGDYSDWIKKVPSVKSYADQYQMIIICPDGNVGSWYFDSPVDSAWKYETFVSNELVKWVDSHLSSIPDKTGRAISGLSMGGHGALYLAFRHPETFGAAGSMSGGVDLTPFPANWDIALRLGSYYDNMERWRSYSVVNMVDKIKSSPPALIIDCGSEDFFFQVNEHLHQKLSQAKIKHDFITRPGQHNWEYWTNAIGYQLLFMHNFFLNGHAN